MTRAIRLNKIDNETVAQYCLYLAIDLDCLAKKMGLPFDDRRRQQIKERLVYLNGAPALEEIKKQCGNKSLPEFIDDIIAKFDRPEECGDQLIKIVDNLRDSFLSIHTKGMSNCIGPDHSDWIKYLTPC